MSLGILAGAFLSRNSKEATCPVKGLQLVEGGNWEELQDFPGTL